MSSSSELPEHHNAAKIPASSDHALASQKRNKKVHFVSLGCAKNLVDSEVMLGHLNECGFEHETDAQEADVLVVNTCSFIGPAKEESIDAILDMARVKNEGKAKKLVVAGCISQRYAPELAKEISEVDHFVGTGNFEEIAEILGEKKLVAQSSSAQRQNVLPVLDNHAITVENHPRLRGKNKLVPYRHDAQSADGGTLRIPDPDFTITSNSPRISTQPAYTAYLKISEGCSNTCAFCIIPKLRGPQRSRSIADVVREAEQLVQRGAVEINLIAQDLCAYGKDLKDKATLAELLRALDTLRSPTGLPIWVRCLYAYPRGLTREVIDVLADATNIVPYLDMPLQHISDKLLRSMRRGKGGPATWELMRRLRQEVPNLILRTTFITGLPGETEADFDELCRFVEETRFERMGVFAYSPEEDTPAAQMPNQVPEELAKERQDHLMRLQMTIAREQGEALVGKELDVLVEGVSEETELLLQGRYWGQAPDIDGVTYINDGQAEVGQVVKVRIEDTMDYDLIGGIVQ